MILDIGTQQDTKQAVSTCMKFTFWCREQKTNTKASVRQVVMDSVEEDKVEP